MSILYSFYSENGDGVIPMVDLNVGGEIHEFSDGVVAIMIIL